MKFKAMKPMNPARCAAGLLLAGWLLIPGGEMFAQEARGLKKTKDTKAEAATTHSSEEDPQAAALTPEISQLPYRLAVLDKVHLNLAGGEVRHLQVSQEGILEMDGDKAKVVGLSKEEVIRLVQGKYPQATTVEVEEFRPNRISVLGEVFHQLNSELADGPMRVMDAIAAANGFTPLANQRRVKLVRQNAGRVEVYELDLRQMMKGENMRQNLLLKPGDVITVPRNFL